MLREDWGRTEESPRLANSFATLLSQHDKERPNSQRERRSYRPPIQVNGREESWNWMRADCYRSGIATWGKRPPSSRKWWVRERRAEILWELSRLPSYFRQPLDPRSVEVLPVKAPQPVTRFQRRQRRRSVRSSRCWLENGLSWKWKGRESFCLPDGDLDWVHERTGLRISKGLREQKH